MSRFRMLASLLLATAALTPAAAHAADCSARAGAHFAGLGGDDSFVAPDQSDCLLSQQAQAGAGVLREGFDWSQIEVAPGVYDFSTYDRWMAAAARHGMHVLPVLATPPSFQVQTPGPDMSPPKSNLAYGRFAAALVGRYGPNGSFWAENPGLPRNPIHDWQIWNEPNLPQYWAGKPNARAYVNMLQAASAAIKGVDPSADIVTAGMPESLITGAIPVSKFLPQLYAAGAAPYFDTLAINPYAPTAADVIAAVQDARDTMDRAGDTGGDMWVTEVGWGTDGPKSRFNIGAGDQATQISALLTGLWNDRHALHLRGVVYFGWRDRAPYAPDYKDMWGLHTGLLDVYGAAKPAFWAFSRLAPQLTGDTVLPHVPGDTPVTTGDTDARRTATAAPKLVVSGRAAKAAAGFTVRCTTRCHVTARLTISKKLAHRLHLHHLTVGTLKRTVRHRGRTSLKVHLTKKTRKAHAKRLSHTKRISAVLSVTAKDAAGHKRTTRRHVHIRI